MNKICTSIEQSNKLIELGIDVNTADMYWWYSGKRYYLEAMDDGDFNEAEGHIRAWSLSALLGLMPFQIIENEQRYGFYQWKGFNSQGETYCFEFRTNIGGRLYETIHWNNPIDAAFEMIVWLKENGKL
jgi:hypothetical protein